MSFSTSTKRATIRKSINNLGKGGASTAIKEGDTRENIARGVKEVFTPEGKWKAIATLSTKQKKVNILKEILKGLPAAAKKVGKFLPNQIKDVLRRQKEFDEKTKGPNWLKFKGQ